MNDYYSVSLLCEGLVVIISYECYYHLSEMISCVCTLILMSVTNIYSRYYSIQAADDVHISHYIPH